ncbi:flagellar export protein FliJ [Atrimonas thermophila]|uniref:flagellar export protein FliJ n=1 Tax=Atrimonas thermophila TaxID=3064161 RepID=UPI00399CEF25
MGYNFKLQKVLDVKKVREELIEVKLAELEKLAERQRRELIIMEEARKEYMAQRTREREQGERLMEEAFFEKMLDNLERKIEELKSYLRELERQIAQTKEELVCASLERKVMEKLREKDYQEFSLNVQKSNQKLLDEVAIQMYLRREI